MTRIEELLEAAIKAVHGDCEPITTAKALAETALEVIRLYSTGLTEEQLGPEEEPFPKDKVLEVAGEVEAIVRFVAALGKMSSMIGGHSPEEAMLSGIYRDMVNGGSQYFIARAGYLAAAYREQYSGQQA